jgi:hypothetical protein
VSDVALVDRAVMLAPSPAIFAQQPGATATRF